MNSNSEIPFTHTRVTLVVGIVPIYIPETEQYDVILRCTIQYALLDTGRQDT
jgi:hypothetical protein